MMLSFYLLLVASIKIVVSLYELFYQGFAFCFLLFDVSCAFIGFAGFF